MAIENGEFTTEWLPRGGAIITHPLGTYEAETKAAASAFYAGVRVGLNLAQQAMNETIAAADREHILNG